MSQHERVLLVDSSGNPIITAPFQFDDTDKLAVSLYGNDAAAGDQSIIVNPDGKLEVVFGFAEAAIDGRSNVVVFPHAPGSGDYRLGADAIHIFNGTSWDRQRGNEEITLLASAARTVETDSAAQVNYNHQGMILFVDVTVDPSTASITPKLVANDPVSGADVVIWTAAAALAATGAVAYLLLPGAADAGSYTEQKELAIPRDWFFRMAVADAESMTYSVSCCML